MSDPIDPLESPSEPLPDAAPAAPPPPRRRWWHRWRLILVLLVVIPVVLFGLFTWSALTWSYSTGERAGYLQKFSRKGWLCKTWEGELALSTVPGVAPTMWYFTVRNAAAAKQVSIANGRRVILYYREHKGIPSSCFGDTNYFVDSVRIVR